MGRHFVREARRPPHAIRSDGVAAQFDVLCLHPPHFASGDEVCRPRSPIGRPGRCVCPAPVCESAPAGDTAPGALCQRLRVRRMVSGPENCETNEDANTLLPPTAQCSLRADAVSLVQPLTHNPANPVGADGSRGNMRGARHTTGAFPAETARWGAAPPRNTTQRGAAACQALAPTAASWWQGI